MGSEIVKRNCTKTRQCKSCLDYCRYTKMVDLNGKGVERSYEKVKWLVKIIPDPKELCFST